MVIALKFIRKCILFLLCVALIAMGIDLISTVEPMRSFLAKLTDSEDYLVREGSDEIFPYIDSVMKEDASHVLVIGDSICRQMFNELDIQNVEITVAAANAAVTVQGQYMLAMAYLDSHPHATDIFLFMHPHSLVHSFSSSTEYQYGVIPFIEKGIFTYLDEDSIDCISKAYGKLFLNEHVVNLIDNSAINRKLYMNSVEKYGKGYWEKQLFELTDFVIPRLFQECEDRGVRLHLFSSPVTTYFAEDMKAKRDEYEKSLTFTFFPFYMENIVFIPSEQTEDMAHFASEYIDKEKFIDLLSDIMQEDMLTLFGES